MIITLNIKKNIVLFLGALFLFVALIDGWPYGFFTFLRFFITGCSIYIAWIFYIEKKELLVWIFGCIAILFNPFIPIYLDRSAWKIIDLIIGFFYFFSIFLFGINKKKKDF